MPKNIPSKETMAANLWLLYFNKQLKEQGLITETEYFRMVRLIHAKYPDQTVQRF